MRENCTSGSVGGEGGNILAYPAYFGPDANLFRVAAPDPYWSYGDSLVDHIVSSDQRPA